MPTWDVQMKTDLQLSPRRPQYPKYDPKTFSTFSSLLDNIKADQRQETLLLKNIVAEAIHNLQHISDPFEYKKEKDLILLSEVLHSISESKSQLVKLIETHQTTVRIIKNKCNTDGHKKLPSIQNNNWVREIPLQSHPRFSSNIQLHIRYSLISKTHSRDSRIKNGYHDHPSQRNIRSNRFHTNL